MFKLYDIKIAKKYAQEQYTIAYTVDGVVKQTTLLPGFPDRGQIINAVMSEEYPVDKMEAVVNNYLLDTTDEDAVQEFNKMQECRKAAKHFADELLNNIE